jgi:cellulose synthase/poly-beta-1,6-N-acetylglucosamine synthase-like glycosyltransferase
MAELWYVLTFILCVEAFITIRSALRFKKFFQNAEARLSHSITAKPGLYPKVALIIPCKGLDYNLKGNIQSWLDQNYPNFEIFVIVESDLDESVAVLKEFQSLRFSVSGKAEHCGQKIHNLRYVIERLPGEFEVLVFADSDGKLKTDWLSSLVGELIQHREDAVTGYRWFLPDGSLFSHFRAVWNSAVLTLFTESGKSNFAWGGATAIFRKTFEEMNIFSYWEGSLSDDLSLTRAIYSAGRKIRFAPRAIALSEGNVTAKEFFSWIARQFLITKLYHPFLWLGTFVYHWIWFVWLITGVVFRPVYFVIAFLVLQFFQGMKAEIRLSCMKRLFGDAAGSRAIAWLLSPVMGLINTVILTSNLFSRTVSWRGIKYRVKGPNSLTIIR